MFRQPAFAGSIRRDRRALSDPPPTGRESWPFSNRTRPTIHESISHPSPGRPPRRFRVVAQYPQLKTGPNADLGGVLLMPADNEWNRDISKDEVDPLSDAIIASIGAETGLHEDFGIIWKGQRAHPLLRGERDPTESAGGLQRGKRGE